MSPFRSENVGKAMSEPGREMGAKDVGMSRTVEFSAGEQIFSEWAVKYKVAICSN